jgi:catechol 2,3-dioxygenase-like lactoylglutathione lyase family enzyme
MVIPTAIGSEYYSLRIDNLPLTFDHSHITINDHFAQNRSLIQSEWLTYYASPKSGCPSSRRFESRQQIFYKMNIGHANVTVNVKDMDKSVSFYQSIGFEVKNRWGNYYAQISAPGIEIGLHPTSNENLKGNSGNVSIGFTTMNIEETKSSLEKLSLTITERSEEGGQFLHFTDPDGTALYFIKSKWG